MLERRETQSWPSSGIRETVKSKEKADLDTLVVPLHSEVCLLKQHFGAEPENNPIHLHDVVVPIPFVRAALALVRERVHQSCAERFNLLQFQEDNTY